MFHIKSDTRSQKTALVIYRTYMELLKEYNYNDITISKIANDTKMSRATFYRHFDTTSDVLEWRCSVQLNSILNSYVKEYETAANPSDILEYLLSGLLVNDNIRVWKILLKNNRHDIIYRTFSENATIFLDFIREKEIYSIDYLGTEYDYFISIRVGCLVGILNGWVKNNQQQTPKEISKILTKQFREISKSGRIF